MTRKEALKRAHWQQQRVRAKIEEIEQLEAIATKCTSTITGMPGAHSDNSKLEAIVIRLIEKRTELEEELNEELAVYEQNKRTIAAIPSNLGRTIFSFRYCNFMTWQQIAEALGYDRSYVAKIHDKILKEMEEQDGKL